MPEPAKLTSISQIVESNLMKTCIMCGEHFVTSILRHIVYIQGNFVVVCVVTRPFLYSDHTAPDTIVPPSYSVSRHQWVCQDFSDVTLAWMCLWSRRRRTCLSATESSPPSSRTSRLGNRCQRRLVVSWWTIQFVTDSQACGQDPSHVCEQLLSQIFCWFLEEMWCLIHAAHINECTYLLLQ